MEEAGLRHVDTSFRGRLEANVLERLSGVPVKTSGRLVVASLHCEVPLCNPRGGAMARRRKLVEDGLGGLENLLGLVEQRLLEQGASERQLGDAASVEMVDAVAEQVERVPCLRLRRSGESVCVLPG